MNTAHIKTGHNNGVAHFQPALYQLTLLGTCPNDGAQNEQRVELGYSGSRLLERLLKTPGEVISREDLIGYAWADRVVGPGSLNQQIHTLRQILGDEKQRQIIQTLPRRGYQLNPDFLLLAALPSVPPECIAPAPLTPVPDSLPNIWNITLKHWRLCAVATVVAIVFPPMIGPRSEPFHANELSEFRPAFQQTVTRAHRLTDYLKAFTQHPLKLTVARLPDGSYEICCQRKSGEWLPLALHGDSRHGVDEEQMKDCLR